MSSTDTRSSAGMVLAVLAAGQFVMALDSSVMNVSIPVVARDVGTDLTGIQTAITLYALVMTCLMITAGKVGQMLGRGSAIAIAAGLVAFFFQNLILLGLSFLMSLYLTVALGLTAIATGVRLMPMSIMLFAAVGIPKLFPKASPRRVARVRGPQVAFAVLALFAMLAMLALLVTGRLPDEPVASAPAGWRFDRAAPRTPLFRRRPRTRPRWLHHPHAPSPAPG